LATTKKKSEPVEIKSGEWYVVAHGDPPYIEECCSCGLVHRQEWKIENGRIYFKYEVDEKATKAARKRRGIKSKEFPDVS
jgi:hypothetical protein